MGGGAGTERGHADLAGVVSGIGDEFRNGPGGNGGIDDQHQGEVDETRHRRDVAEEIERQRVKQRDIDGSGCRDKEQRVAVRRSADGRLDRDVGGCARFVLNDDRLAKALRQPLGHDARHGVTSAARRKPDDPSQRPRRVVKRERAELKHWRRNRRHGELQELTARTSHDRYLPCLATNASTARLNTSGSSQYTECPDSGATTSSALGILAAIMRAIDGGVARSAAPQITSVGTLRVASIASVIRFLSG